MSKIKQWSSNLTKSRNLSGAQMTRSKNKKVWRSQERQRKEDVEGAIETGRKKAKEEEEITNEIIGITIKGKEKEEAIETEIMSGGEIEEDTTLIVEGEITEIEVEKEETNDQTEEKEVEKEEKEVGKEAEIEAEIETREVETEANIGEEEEVATTAATLTETSKTTKSKLSNKPPNKRKTRCPSQRQEKVGQNATFISSASNSA